VGSASAQGGVEGHLFWECLNPSVLVDLKNWRFFFAGLVLFCGQANTFLWENKIKLLGLVL
jgi:hypothetical protein